MPRKLRAVMHDETETELKLDVAPRCAGRIFAHPSFKGRFRGRMARTHLVTVYYDTPQFDLWRAQVSLRLRRSDAGWLQTVKWGGTAAGGLHRRNELEQPAAGQALDLGALAGRPGLEVLADARLRRKLKPLFVTEFERATRMLALPEGGRIEASLDRGRIVCGTTVRALCELELELQAGTAVQLFDVAQPLVRDLPVRPAHRSKAERGYLLAGLDAGPVKARRAAMDPAETIGQAAARLLASGLAQVQSNAEGMLAATDIEYLHQLRVGVRRLRSCLSALGGAVPEGALDTLAGELRWLGARLGSARDWDVFRHEFLPRMRRGLAPAADASGLEALAQASKALGDRAARGARLAWQSRRTHLLLLELGRAAAGGGFVAQHEGLHRPVLPYSAALLTRRLDRVLRLGKRARGKAPIGELHELRIAVKKLRYSVEFFGPLYPADRAQRFRDRLVKLQDCLGRICDAEGIVERMRVAMPAGGSLVDFARGWSACTIQGERAQLAALWRHFRHGRAFW